MAAEGTDAELAAGAAAFDMPTLLQSMRALGEHENLPVDLFLDSCEQVSRIFCVLGFALKFAAQDVQQKLGLMRERLAEFRARNPEREAAEGAPPLTVREMIEDEKARDMAIRGSKDPPSAARSAQRLEWFLVFTHRLLEKLVEDEQVEVKDAAGAAYGETLHAHHKWIVRRAVQAGLYACPYRANFETTLGGGSREGVNGHMQELHQLLGPVNEKLGAIFRELDLMVIP